MTNTLNSRALWLTNVWTTQGGRTSQRPDSLKTIDICQYNTADYSQLYNQLMNNSLCVHNKCTYSSYQERCTQDWCSRSMVCAKTVRNQMVSPCMEWWGAMDNHNQATFRLCLSTMFLPVWQHCPNSIRNKCQEDFNSFPLEELEETTRVPLYY